MWEKIGVITIAVLSGFLVYRIVMAYVLRETLYRKPTYRELVSAIDQFVEDRIPSDINTLPLYRVWVRLNREGIKPCPDCDQECDEPCNTDAEEAWAKLDLMEKEFRGKR